MIWQDSFHYVSLWLSSANQCLELQARPPTRGPAPASSSSWRRATPATTVEAEEDAKASAAKAEAYPSETQTFEYETTMSVAHTETTTFGTHPATTAADGAEPVASTKAPIVEAQLQAAAMQDRDPVMQLGLAIQSVRLNIESLEHSTRGL